MKCILFLLLLFWIEVNLPDNYFSIKPPLRWFEDHYNTGIYLGNGISG